MAILLTGTTIGGHSAIHAGNLATHGIITTSNIGSYAITSIPTNFSSITVTSSFDTASNDVYASMRVIRNNSSTYQDGMYIGYGNSGSGPTRIFGGGYTSGELIKYATYTYEPGSFRAPIFYDSADTSYYLDPNSTSYLYHLVLSGNSYFRPNTWIQFDGSYGLYWPNNYALHIYPNANGSHGALQINGTKGGWAGIYFNDSANTLMANSNESGFHRQGNGWQFRWTEGTMYVHRSTSGGGTAYTVLDTGNYNSFGIPTKQYIWSRGENLLTNGTGLLGNNTNFSSFTFDGSQAYSSSGSFRYTGQYHAPNTDELMPVNAEKRYRLDFWAKTANGQGAYYAYLNFFDVDGNAIVAPYHMYYPNTLTTLAQTLNPGDTVAYLTSVANWENGGTAGVNTHLRSFIFWNYTNSFGYTYPPQTYSRNWYPDAWNPGAINSGNNTITLRVPWSGPSIAAGTQVSNGSAGGTFKYIALGYTIVPTTWTNYVGIMDGIDYSGSNAGGKFPPGTAAAKLGFLTDYNGSGDTIYLANLFVGVDNDYPIYDRWTGNTRINKSGAFYGTIFYDSNNDGYYLDPNSTSNLYRVDAAAQMRAPIFYDSQDTNYYLDPNSTSRLGTLNINQLSVYGNTYLGDGNGDEVHINDILRVGATDSGDAHIFFGEGGSAGSDYGAHLYWDSGYRFTWYTRNAGTDSTLFYYDTNSLSYITWGRSLSMNTNSIDYTGQLHFSGGTRFQSIDTHYLKFRTDATDYGSIQVRDGNESLKGHLGYFDANGFGLLNSAGNWGIRLNPGNVGTELFYAGNIKLATLSEGTRIYGNLHLDDNYGYGIVGVYSSSRYQGIFAMDNAYKLSADGTSTGNLYGLAWSHPNAGGQTKGGLEHQLLVMNYGVTQTAIGTGIWTSGLITTTSYGTSANWKSAYDWGNHASAGYLRLNTWEGNSYIATGGAHYGTIFYDSNDSAYYIDPNSSSRVSRLWVDKLGGIGTYSWVNAALTTSSIEIVNQVGENGSLPPTLAFHWYGDGGPQFRLAADTSNILYLESAAAGSANTATNSTTYFNSLRLICQDATGLYVNGNGVWHRGDFSSANISNWNTAYSWGNHASAGYLTGAHNHDDRYYTESESDSRYLSINGGTVTGWALFTASTQGTAIVRATQQDTSAGYYLFQGITGSSEVFRVERSGRLNSVEYIYSYGYRGNGNVGGTGNASWHPDGAYIGSTMWQYGTMYKNNTGIYDVSEFKLNAGPVLGTYNTRNLIVKAHDSNDVMGILGQKSGGGFAFQIYGDGTNYGFLDSAWGGWDIRKTIDGAMYMNDDNSYYLQTNSTSNFVALNIQGNAVVHAGNIGSQSVSNSNYINSTRDTPVSALQYWQAPGLGIDEAPSSDWHNTIRMGHGSPLSYYSNTLAIRMTGSGVGDIYTQTIMNGNRQGWKKHWNDGNHGSGSGLDADLLDGQQGSYYQPASSAITTSNIGSQSVSYASTAGSLTSMNISQFTNNSGYLTGITSGQVTGALGYTPYNSSNPSGYITSSGSISGNAATATYATTAGSAPANGGNSATVGGYSVSVGASANTIPTRNASGYLIPESWIQLNGIYGLYSPTNNAHLRPNDASYGSWQMTGSRNGWQGIEFNSGTNGNVTMMISTDSRVVGFHNNSYGWQIRWDAGTLYIGKGTYGSSDATVLDSSNYSTWAQPIASAINTGNIGSQSVSYASSAGSAGSVTGLTLTSSANGINPDSVTQNQIGYNTSVSLFGQTDGGLYSSAYSSAWIHQIYGDFRTGQIAIRGKNSGSWQAWRTVLDSSNYTSYAPSLTGSGASGTWSINVTGSAGSVAWTNVSSRPTALSQFTNDLGNYGGFLTSITAHTHAISDISGLQTALDGKQAAGSYAASSHTHDDRYYTESESDTRFARRDADSAISGNLVIGNGTYGSSTAYGNSGARLMFSGSDGDAQGNYYIGTNHNDYGGNYSKLELRWHTGIRMGAQPGYGGIRFYDTEDLGTVIFSVGTGDSHVRVTNNLYVGGNLALHAGNYNSYSPTLTGGNASGTWGISVTGNAATVGGYAVSGSVGANTVVIRDANNYIYAHYINSNVSESENPTINSFYTSNGDGWLRKSSVAHVKSQLGLGSMAYESSGTYQTVSGAINTGNIGSQSVSYATISQQLTKFGDIYGQDWNTYYVNGKMIVSSVYGGSGPNFPTGAYNYGAMLSYGVTGSEFFQVYFPENGALQGGAFRKLHYRTGWNGSWSAWKSVVDQEGQVCTIAGSNQTGIEIHSNVSYNQDPLTYFLMRGQADSSWKAFKVRLTGDAGGQDIEFRRIAENGTDSRMWYVPRGANTVNFEYPIVQPSDSRLKDNITPISTPVDKIKSLCGVEFDWNSGEQVGTHDVGLIAQDVEAVLPEAVTTQEDGYKNLAYTKVIPLLVEAMKEQQAMIDALKAEIELLKNK